MIPIQFILDRDLDFDLNLNQINFPLKSNLSYTRLSSILLRGVRSECVKVQYALKCPSSVGCIGQVPVQVVWFKVQGGRCKLQAARREVRNARCNSQGSTCKVQGALCKMCKVQNARCKKAKQCAARQMGQGVNAKCKEQRARCKM